MESPPPKNIHANIPKLYLMNFFGSMYFLSAVLVPFYLDWGHIRFAQVMLLQSWFMGCAFALELPSGTMADYLGRKKTMCLGFLINIAAVLVYTAAPVFWLFLVGEFLWGASMALVSGTSDALVYDTLKISGIENQSKEVFGRFHGLSMVGLIVATSLGSVIAQNIGLRETMLFMIVPFGMAFLIALNLQEPILNDIQIHKAEKRKGYFTIMKEGLKILRDNHKVKALALELIFPAILAYFIIWLYQLRLRTMGVDILYFGMINTAFILLEIVVMNTFGFLERVLKSKRRLMLLTVILTSVGFLLCMLNSVPFIIFGIILAGGFGMARPVLVTNYINKYIPSEERATVLSSVSMLRQLGLVILNPIIGFLAETSLTVLFLGIGILGIVWVFLTQVKEEDLIEVSFKNP